MAMSSPFVDAPLRRIQNGPAFRPVLIASERCKGCSLCIDACAPHALALDVAIVNAMGYHPVALIDEAACTSCAKCARMCPDAVLTIFARAEGG